MNRDDITRIYLQVSDELCGGKEWCWEGVGEPLQRFAALVAAAERERIKWDTIHSCHPECDKPVCVAIRKAVAEEREVCADIAENWRCNGMPRYGVAEAIRERGAPALERLNKAAEDNGEPL